MKKKRHLLVLFFIAFLLRIFLVFSAYHGDLNNNISWATTAVEKGLSGFYEMENWSYSAPNQPPLTILTFAAVRVVWQSIENLSWSLNNSIALFPSSFIWFWESKGMTLLIKLPSIIADLGIGYVIYLFFEKRKNSKKGLILSALWLFNPISWYNSAVWGQTDAIVNLLGLLSVYFALDKKLVRSFLFITLSVLFKGSLVIFIPVLLAVWIFQKYDLRVWLKGLLYSLVAVFVVSVCFHPMPDLLFWLFNLYKNTIFPGEIGTLSANAFDFWWLVNPGKILDSKMFTFLSARRWGFIILLAFESVVIYWLKKKISKARIVYSLAVVSLVAFLFMTRIHPRYLYPFFPMANLLLGLIPSVWVIYLLFSVTHLLNIYYLFWVPPFAFLENLYNYSYFTNLIALTNLVLLVFFLRLLRLRKL